MNNNTYPNQRRVTIHKCESKRNYSKIDIQASKNAMRTLGYSAYMLYMYFCMNATSFQVNCSRVAICNETGLSKNVYYNAFEKLVVEGFLVRKPGTQCLFDFYESPILACISNPESGKARPQNRENSSPKQVENIKNNIENIARGSAQARSTGENKTPIKSFDRTKKRLRIDM